MTVLDDVAAILLEIAEAWGGQERQRKLMIITDLAWAAADQGITPESVLAGGRATARRYLESMDVVSTLTNADPAPRDRSPTTDSDQAWSRVRYRALKSLLVSWG